MPSGTAARMRVTEWLVLAAVTCHLIGSTKTKVGLSVRSELDRGTYPIRIVDTNQQMARIRLVLHSFHSHWNHTARPNR